MKECCFTTVFVILSVFFFSIGLHAWQDPPPPFFFEAILVVFGRSSLFIYLFIFGKLLENMKKGTTFMRMRSGDHLWDAKNVEKRHLASSNLTFNELRQTETVSHQERRRAELQKVATFFLIFAPGLSYGFSNLVMILPRFSTSKDHN